MLVRSVLVALVLGAGGAATAAPVCQPGAACVVRRPVPVVVATAQKPAPDRSYSREIALLAGIGVLALLVRRRRFPTPEVVS